MDINNVRDPGDRGNSFQQDKTGKTMENGNVKEDRKNGEGSGEEPGWA